jgi:hypothetical protein
MRLLESLNGRRLDEVDMLDPDVRRDIDAEAGSGDPHAILELLAGGNVSLPEYPSDPNVFAPPLIP